MKGKFKKFGIEMIVNWESINASYGDNDTPSHESYNQINSIEIGGVECQDVLDYDVITEIEEQFNAEMKQ